jgi:plastocyanin
MATVMYRMSPTTATYVTACTLLFMRGLPVSAAELSVTVHTPDGRGVSGAVVAVEPAVPGPPAGVRATASMDQRALQFVPNVLIVRSGTAVDFPNSDQVRHQVYSFSPAKPFQLALYAGRAHPPVIFSRPGLITLGCNIHDAMIGYIYVTDSPWFGGTAADGTLQLSDLPAGDYTVRVWHPRMAEVSAQLAQRVTVMGNGRTTSNFRLARPLRPAMRGGGAEKSWEDY